MNRALLIVVVAQVVLVLRARLGGSSNAWGSLDDLGVMVWSLLVLAVLGLCFGLSFLRRRWSSVPLAVAMGALLLVTGLSVAGLVPLFTPEQRRFAWPESVVTLLASGAWLFAWWTRSKPP